ncbi:hypothetical protein BDV98DRAFT_510914 [Pterulicium gracile]|uniref:Nitrogen regulatory protein areA GATA-like domain-containing protein n=1 Tax=Pterulicium gracile TaxID=1884261 RepID=A0A5C3QCS7_9AGAR|nr:hypothetical protein BDV98DRAFT_510914 [Pterula gracilis]
MPMSFPSPVLSVTAGAVLQLEESNDALQALWTVFTKCKASLQDGHRLENATWRLWYREMSLSPKPYRPPTPDSPCDPPSSTNGLGYLDVQRRSNDGSFIPMDFPDGLFIHTFPRSPKTTSRCSPFTTGSDQTHIGHCEYLAPTLTPYHSIIIHKIHS